LKGTFAKGDLKERNYPAVKRYGIGEKDAGTNNHPTEESLKGHKSKNVCPAVAENQTKEGQSHSSLPKLTAKVLEGAGQRSNTEEFTVQGKSKANGHTIYGGKTYQPTGCIGVNVREEKFKRGLTSDTKDS